MSKLEDDWKILDSRSETRDDNTVDLEFLHSETQNKFRVVMSKNGKTLQKEFNATAPLDANGEPDQNDMLRFSIVAVSIMNDL